jgi:L-amino acid N-acyltransferase YncA
MRTGDRQVEQVTGRAQAELRACGMHDMAAVTAIYGHAVIHGLASFELEAPDEAEMTRRFEAMRGGGYPYLVATCESEVAGYAYAAAYRTRPAYRSTVENSVYVRVDMQGRGIGRLLLGALIEEAAVRSFRQMIAVIGDSANTASIRLHEALGFTHVGVFRSVGWKHERWLDTVLMQRELGLGDGAPPSFSGRG